MRNLIPKECQAQSLVPFLTPGTESVSMLFEKVRMLFMHCFHHVLPTKKTVEEC